MQPTEAQQTDPVVPVTGFNRRRKHWAREGTLKTAPRGAGRQGPTLCGDEGEDQERCDARDRQWGAVRRKPLVIADLPECRLCARSKEKTNG